MKKIFLNNWAPLLLYFLLFSTALYFIIGYSKVSIHLYINNFVGNNYIDVFFKYITYIGDGWFVPLFVLLIAVFNLRLALVCLISFVIAVLISITLKFVFFDDVVRPWYTFQWLVHEKVTYVKGVQLYLYNSFPSGHSTQAFALFVPVLMFVNQNKYKLLILSIALLAAFSRTYLSMHWLEDIVAGSLIGLVTGVFVYLLILEKNRLLSLNRSLFKIHPNVLNEK